MDAGTTIGEAGEGATFRLTPASGPPGPFVFASPHSGRLYPPDMGARPLDERSLRSAEDAMVDRLVASGPERGAPLIAGLIGRGYVDLNRAADELDARLIGGVAGTGASPRAMAGYGVIPRLSGDGQPLYDRRLTATEVARRVARVHEPYHRALAQLMQAARERHGRAVLVDWHSMPSTGKGPAGPDVVIGDRHGSSCDPALTRRLRAGFEALGWRVALNHPYAGGYSTRLWARRSDGFEAVQIELSRALYLDDTTLEPSAGWSRCEKGVARVIAALTADTPGS
ncbi:N-formylglutamate amidohydrolase [Rhizobium sp. CRIBSB]|nr:N-formylglutamate amidohydrolase [Rhizobium sp. CRIBSB]